jgi:uncharacterized protein (DUF433 family)
MPGILLLASAAETPALPGRRIRRQRDARTEPPAVMLIAYEALRMTDWKEMITADPKVMVGKPVIVGTRLTVEFIVERFADGWTEEELLQNYPGLTREQIHACLAYAAPANG